MQLGHTGWGQVGGLAPLSDWVCPEEPTVKKHINFIEDALFLGSEKLLANHGKCFAQR